ncbi:MAG TPA: GtrA family protein [Solirubrobacteraceae bacterium]|nr:GtrA family protein [Solirubrobacteraceae bacterium]
MTDELAATVDAPPRFRTRMHAGVRKQANWLQLVRFGLVGASGYVVNLAVFTLLVHAAGAHYRLAATGAFLVAVANNFHWNRHWTFRARGGHAGFQAARFLTVSLAAFGFNLLVLEILIAGLGAPEVPAQALAILAATPLSFLGNKLWSFAR